MARQDLVIRIAGEAGEGVLITGQMVTQATARAGYYVLTDSVPPAEIKGGYSFYQIRLGEKRLRSRGDTVDVLLAIFVPPLVTRAEDVARAIAGAAEAA